MIYSTRLKKILEVCLRKDEYVKVDFLAESLKTSTRTIFREIKDIDKDLESYGVTLVSKTGKGMKVEGSEEAKKALLLELQTQNIQYMNKEERQNLLIFELLRNDEIQKLFHYANLFQVSEATISNDLDSIEPWFEKYALHVSRKPGIGIEVLGEEQHLRRAMTDILNQSLHDKESYGQVNHLDSQTLLSEIFLSDKSGGIMKLLNQDILERILVVFHSYQHELLLDRYAQTSYIGLIIHLVIAIERIIKKEEMSDLEHVIDMVKDDDCYLQAKRMAHYLEIEFDIDIPEAEIAFIALHIKGAKTTSSKVANTNDEESHKMQMLIRRMLATYDKDIAIYLQQDEELFHGLLTHLPPTITRLKNHLPIFNPLLKQIKDEYMQLYEQTETACRCLQEEYGCKVSEDEIGFITMHIGASIERMQHRVNNRTIKIGVVCASGIGVSSLLSARIQKAIITPLDIHVFSMDEIVRKKYKDCELLISTFPLEVDDCMVIQVTPLLNCKDITNIEKALANISMIPAKQEGISIATFKEELRMLKDISTYALELLEHIQYIKLPAGININTMMQEASKVAVSDMQQQKQILEDLKKREQQGSVIMKDYQFGLLHAKSSGITHSDIQFLYPDESTLFSEVEGMKFMMVMLLPMDANRIQQELLSTISRGLIESSSLRNAIINQKPLEIEEEISILIQDYIDSKVNL